MMPLGLHHLFAWGHHYGPEPYCQQPGARADWMPSYYHRADSLGLGFNRSSHAGTDATHQYPAPYAALLDDPATCPSEHLLWFHHIPWQQTITHRLLHIGQRRLTTTPTTYQESLWQALCRHYQSGVDEVRTMQREWSQLRASVNPAIHADIDRRLECQLRDAEWWRDACLLYFQSFSHQPMPAFVEQPRNSLDFFKAVRLGIDNYTCPTIQLLDSKR